MVLPLDITYYIVFLVLPCYPENPVLSLYTDFYLELLSKDCPQTGSQFPNAVQCTCKLNAPKHYGYVMS